MFWKAEIAARSAVIGPPAFVNCEEDDQQSAVYAAPINALRALMTTKIRKIGQGIGHEVMPVRVHPLKMELANLARDLEPRAPLLDNEGLPILGELRVAREHDARVADAHRDVVWWEVSYKILVCNE